ncbi:MAG: transglycosylase domain-containing protein, partial [Leptospiraceae bacterium]|nr:transglycosylase domain-containing protein [Leptospiraceae bacterium]
MKIYFLSFLLISVNISAEGIPSFEEVKQNFQNSEFHLLDKNENILQVLRQNPKERKLNWTSLEEISPSLLDSIRIAEDKKFFEHNGVDWLALGDGLVRAITFSSPRGASTISMQVAGILHEKWKPKRRNLWQKWTQIQLALELEKKWSKQQILETYLNLVTFRGELVGIASASWGLFQKHPHALTKEESLLLASMPKNPSFSLERLSQRACYLQKVQYSQEDCSKLKEFVWKHLSKNYSIQHKENYAYHLGRKVLNENKELKYLSLIH